MKILENWSEKVVDKEQAEQSINDLCFRPDGTQLVVAAGSKVLVYDPLDGSLVKVLPGHKEPVYCLTYAKDGSLFASGGADKMVIIWTAELEGTLRFSHNDAIQALAFNPVSNVLLTCSITDFGLWSLKDKSVPKTKVSSRITCCSWTNDGQIMALGFFNGCVQIRDKNGEEKLKIERPDAANSPIWSLQWNPSQSAGDVLAVVDWSQKISFYQANGKQASKERKLGFDATQLSWHTNGDYILISGSNKECAMYSTDGVKLQTICQQDCWVLCAKHKPDSSFIAVGCQDGTVIMYHTIMSTVHGLYKERYAYREGMSDVIVQNLLTGVKVKIKCKDLVKKLAVYKNRLAVQLPDKVVIYEIDSQDPKDMSYKGKRNISKKFDCNLFFITHENLIICDDKKLECLNLKGEKIREWQMEYQVRYMKVIGGREGKESLLVGLKSGHVYQIFVDSAFPMLLIKLENTIKYADLSSQRLKLAVIDDNLTLFVYNLKTGDLMFQEPNANSVAWNSLYEDLLAYSGGGNVCVNVVSTVVLRQRLQGFVIGFSGSNIYYLNSQSVSTIEIAHTNGMLHYMERKQYKDAYDIACLGVTHKDWDNLGLTSLENNQVEVARKSFIRTRDYKMLNLIFQFLELKRQGLGKNDILLGLLYAYQSKFTEAARCFRKAGDEQLAMSMFTDLRMFDMAKEYLTGADTGSDKNSILLKQAEWAIRSGDAKTAAELYISARQFNKAIDIVGKNNWPEMLLEIVRKLDKADREALSKCGEMFRRMGLPNFAAEAYEKMGNIEELVELRMEAKQWDEVFALAKRYPDIDNKAHFRYGQWLAENDRFEEAQKAFNQAGFKNEAIKVLEELTNNAVAENRFTDASYYYWLMSNEHLQVVCDEPNDSIREKSLKKFHQYQHLAEIYYVYHHIHCYVVEPFTEDSPETLFNASRFLLHELSREIQFPQGISRFKILYTALKMSKDLQANKYARYIIDRIDEIVVPNKYSEQIDQIAMSVRARPFKDEEELLPLCYRCSHHNALVSPEHRGTSSGACGNECANCGQPYVFSFASFEPLPLVEFILPDDISDEEALNLIDFVPNSQFDKDAEMRHREAIVYASGIASTSKSTNRLVIGDESNGPVEKDPFVALINKHTSSSNEYRPVVVNREVLRGIDPTHVLICKWPVPMRWKFYKIILTNEPIIKCEHCNRFFHTEDYELKILRKGCCPFCRRSNGHQNKEKSKD